MALTGIVTEPTADVALQVSDVLPNLSDVLTNPSEPLTNLSEAPTNLSDILPNVSEAIANLGDRIGVCEDKFSVAVDPVSQATLHRPHVGSDEPVEAAKRHQQHDELSPVLHPCGSGGCSGGIGIDHVSCLRCVPPNLARTAKNRHSGFP